MTKLLLLLSLLLVAVPQSRAQSNCNLSFTSQAQLDGYYLGGGCIIANSLRILGGPSLLSNGQLNPNRIRHLDGLLALTEVSGDVYLDLGDLTNLQGLKNLKRIGGNLTINGATSLTGIGLLAGNDLLPSLETVGGDIGIGANPSLTLFTGLENVRSARSISVGSASLVNFRGFTLLQRCNGPIIFSKCPKLRSIQSFPNLHEINTSGYGLLIQGLPELDVIGGFASLHDVTGSIQIRNNPNLQEITGFDNLRHIQQLDISTNPKLRAINGFDNALEASHSIFIVKNSALQTIKGFQSLKTPSLSIVDNLQLREIIGFNGCAVDEQLTIQGHAALTTLDGFRDMLRSPRYVTVILNPILASITGFTGPQAPQQLWVNGNTALTSLEKCFVYADYSPLTTLYLNGNTRLATCTVPWLCQYLARKGFAQIERNAARGC